MDDMKIGIALQTAIIRSADTKSIVGSGDYSNWGRRRKGTRRLGSPSSPGGGDPKVHAGWGLHPPLGEETQRYTQAGVSILPWGRRPKEYQPGVGRGDKNREPTTHELQKEEGSQGQPGSSRRKRVLRDNQGAPEGRGFSGTTRELQKEEGSQGQPGSSRRKRVLRDNQRAPEGRGFSGTTRDNQGAPEGRGFSGTTRDNQGAPEGRGFSGTTRELQKEEGSQGQPGTTRELQKEEGSQGQPGSSRRKRDQTGRPGTSRWRGEVSPQWAAAAPQRHHHRETLAAI
ncbi:hypothetical protein NHX12_006266, partial [Muraenolepis orangiensis]